MPRRYSGAELARLLRRLGFDLIRQRGSHQRYRGVWRGEQRNITLVANQREIPPKTLRSIAAQLGISAGELERLLSDASSAR